MQRSRGSVYCPIENEVEASPRDVKLKRRKAVLREVLFQTAIIYPKATVNFSEFFLEIEVLR